MSKNKFPLIVALTSLIGCSSMHSSGLPQTSLDAKGDAKRNATTTKSAHHIVVTYQPVATEIGYSILRQGGNAFDAFVAATAAEYILADGYTSFAGPLGALLYDAKSKSTVYLDAVFNEPLNPKQQWDPKNPKPGGAVLVPGAVAGLEAISSKYGKLPFKDVLRPAIKLAEEGFPLSANYAATIQQVSYLKDSPYGRETYFRNGHALKAGEIIKFPRVAEFLRSVADQGSQYVYAGAWAKECIAAVNAQGGHLGLDDFAAYKAEWRKPWQGSYRGHEIYSSRTSGGLSTLLALKVLEHQDLKNFGVHYSSSVNALELLLRVQNEVRKEPGLYDETKLDDPDFESAVFSPSHIDPIWLKVQQKRNSQPAGETGHHSSQIIVADSDGNVITGTNTIESLQWGKGLFVQGVPLTASGMLTAFATKPGQRRRTPFTMQIGFKDEHFKFAAGAFSLSMTAAEFQFLINVIDYGLAASDAVSLPRFGDFVVDLEALKAVPKIWLDQRIDHSIAKQLSEKTGLTFVQTGFVDTGMGAVVTADRAGDLEGAIAKNSVVGIGVGMNPTASGEFEITQVYPGSPALGAGLAQGDFILTVQHSEQEATQTLKGMKPEAVAELIRGQKGTSVILGIRKRSGEVISVKVIRAEIKR